MTVEQEHPAWGVIRQVGHPVPAVARRPASIRTPPPTLGQDTDAILGELGYDSSRIADIAGRRDRLGSR